MVDCLDEPGPFDWSRGRPFTRTPIPAPPELADVPRRFTRYGIPDSVFASRLDAALASLGKPDGVVLTCLFTYAWTGAARAIRLMRERLPGVPIALGGVYAALCPEHAERRSGADLVLSGPFERPDNWAKLWGMLGTGPPPLPDAAGLAPALDLHPEPGFAPLLWSRGCPDRCAYCASGLLHPGFRERTSQSIHEEIRTLRKQGVRDLVFADDALLFRAEELVLPMLRALIDMGAPFRLHAPNALHARRITPEIAGLLKRAGLRTLRLGVESVDFAGRPDDKLGPDDLAAALDALHRAGFGPEEIGLYLLFGLPGRSLDGLFDSIAATGRLGATPIPTAYSPLPQTALFAQAKAVANRDLEEPLNQNNAVWPCIPGGFDWTVRARIRAAVRAATDVSSDIVSQVRQSPGS